MDGDRLTYRNRLYVPEYDPLRLRLIQQHHDTLFVTISQSGETADTLAALRNAKELGFLASLAICNVSISSLVRESDLTLLTQAGREIGVASTKAFTTQLVGLLLLTLSLGQVHGTLAEGESQLSRDLPVKHLQARAIRQFDN